MTRWWRATVKSSMRASAICCKARLAIHHSRIILVKVDLMHSSIPHTFARRAQQASHATTHFKFAICLGLLALSGFIAAPPASAQEASDAPAEAAVQQSPAATTTAAETASLATDVQPAAVQPSDAGSTVTLSRTSVLIGSFTIFMLAVFVGFEIITKVPPTLHTPLMSGSNAISGITVVGAILTAGAAAATSGAWFGASLGMVAAVLAMINVVGGFMVTHRMLMMFKKR